MILHCLTNDIIEILKDKNIYIFGAGQYASDVRTALDTVGLHAKANIVDDTYNVDYDYESILSLGKYENSEDDIIIYGMASVARFRALEREAIFKDIYILYEPNPIWEYDSEFWNENYRAFERVLRLYEDNLSINVAKAFLEAKKGNISSDIKYATQYASYFNELTSNCFKGAYVDCGAFDGDSVLSYLKFYGKYGSDDCEVFAFEPDNKSFLKMSESFKTNKTIYCINKGIWKGQGLLYIDETGGMDTKLVDEEDRLNRKKTIEVTSIDDTVGENTIGFIKMDIEGSELEGLKGAYNTIRRDRPILAISAYHKQEDLISLPKYIKSFDDDKYKYKLFLRHHGICASELVLYGIPELIV